MKKLTRILVTCLMILSLSVTAFAAELPKGASERGYSFYYRDGEDGIIETPLEGEITVAHHPAIDSAISARGVYTYTVTQTSKGLYDGYYPITTWALGPGVLTYTAGVGTTVSFEVSGSVSGDVDVPVAKLSAELGASVGGSTTFTASESIQYNIPSRYKGRVIMRYYQDIFHFNWEKKLLGITVSSGSGSAWSNGRDPYYARQLISRIKCSKIMLGEAVFSPSTKRGVYIIMSNSTIIRKGMALITVFALLFVLTSCTNENPNNVGFNSEKVNILELDEIALVNEMIFDLYAVSLLHNINEEVPINRTVDVYGVLLTESDCDAVKSALTNRFSSLALYSNDMRIITADEYTVDAIPVQEGILFTLHLVVDSVPYVNKTHNIDRVEFAYSSGTTVSKEVSEFSLTFYREERPRLISLSSPTANAAAIAKNEFLVVNYMFLCANEKAKDNFNVSFEIPEKIETMVGTSLLEIEEDKEMTKTAISALYLDLTPEQRESLKVYKMLVSFTKKTDRGFIVQLLFDTDILGEHQYIGAFCPLIIQ